MIDLHSLNKLSAMVICAVGILFVQLNCAFGEEKKKSDPIVAIPDATKGGEGFSFQKGKIVPLFDKKASKAKYSLEVDVFWDPTGNGLLANHVGSGRGFSGNARIADLGKIELSDVRKVPEKLELLTVVVPKKGHTYCIRFAGGTALFHVLDCDRKDRALLIAWKYHAEPNR